MSAPALHPNEGRACIAAFNKTILCYDRHTGNARVQTPSIPVDGRTKERPQGHSLGKATAKFIPLCLSLYGSGTGQRILRTNITSCQRSSSVNAVPTPGIPDGGIP